MLRRHKSGPPDPCVGRAVVIRPPLVRIPRAGSPSRGRLIADSAERRRSLGRHCAFRSPTGGCGPGAVLLARASTVACLLLMVSWASAQAVLVSADDGLRTAALITRQAPGGWSTSSCDLDQSHSAMYPEIYGWVMWWSANREEFLEPSGVGFSAASRPAHAPGRPTPKTIRDEIVPVLVTGLKDDEREIRRSSALALGLCGGEREVDLVNGMLSDRDRSVREAAIVGLGLLGQPRADAILTHLLTSSAVNARDGGFAALALGLSGGETARAVLTDELGSGSTPSVEVCRVLGAGLWAGADLTNGSTDRPAHAASLIQAALSRTDIKNRAFLGTGAAALSKTRDTSSAAFVIKALSDGRREMRLGAAIASGRVVRAADTDSVQGIIKALRAETHVLTRRLLLISLGRIGGAEARKVLLEELGAKERHHRSFAALALGIAGASEGAQRLREELRGGSDERVRGACMIALGIMKDPHSFDVVVEMTKTILTDELRTHYLWFFALARDPKAVPIIRRVLLDTQEAEYQELGAIVLGIIGSSDAQGVLIDMLQTKGPSTTRVAGAAGLGRMGDWRGLAPLRRVVALKEESPTVRAAAIAALGVIGRRQACLPLPRISIDSLYDGVLSEPIDELSRMGGTGRLNSEHRGNRGF